MILTPDHLASLRITEATWTDRLAFEPAFITALDAEVTVTRDYGIRAWIGVLTSAPDAFSDGREFVEQQRAVVRDAEPERTRTKSGIIRWDITADGLYEYGNFPKGGTSLTRGFFVRHGDMIAPLGYARKSDILDVLADLAPARTPRRRDADVF